jgi:hypothetical protein
MADDRYAPQVAEVAKMLGLPADTPPQTILDTAMRRMDEIEAAHDRRVAAAAVRGTDCPPPPRRSSMERVLDWAQATKRMSAAARPQWEANWQKDPEGTEALVRIPRPCRRRAHARPLVGLVGTSDCFRPRREPSPCPIAGGGG